MAGADPLAAISARVAAAQAAMLEAAINLGVSAEVLQAQIAVGDVLQATILPPQNGQDLIQVLGQRVAAQLPPGIDPGETLLLQVTGFSGTQIFVRNLGTPDPQNPVPVNQAVLATPPESGTPPAQTAVLTSISITETAPIAPPREVFVAASVRQAQQASAQTPAPAPQAPVPGVEARIAAAQAAKAPPVANAAPPANAAQPANDAQPANAAPPVPELAHIPPLIPGRAPAAAASAAPQNAAPKIVQRAAQTVSEFLRAARLPDTPFTRMAATIAPQAPQRLPSVLARLDTALPRTTEDPRIPTLRTLIGFTARMNPANAQTLRAQISSYVSNVIQGVEAKLAQLLQAHTRAQTAAAASEAPHAAQSAQPAQPAKQTGFAAPQNSGDAPQLSATAAQARIAERSAAISHDLKSVVLSLLREPPAGRTPALAQALNEALITLTGTQINALSSNAQNPDTLTLSLPVYYHEGGKPAQIRISRDAESRAAKMDGDNFHVAFVLDTANLGTVAIDLQSTGRTVKLDVKTERASSAARFSDTLSSLRTRLEDLRYRVASAHAGTLPPAAPSKTAAASAAQDGVQKKRGVDLQA